MVNTAKSKYNWREAGTYITRFAGYSLILCFLIRIGVQWEYLHGALASNASRLLIYLDSTHGFLLSVQIIILGNLAVKHDGIGLGIVVILIALVGILGVGIFPWFTAFWGLAVVGGILAMFKRKEDDVLVEPECDSSKTTLVEE